jgi:CDGSH-type Zn-finger protein
VTDTGVRRAQIVAGGPILVEGPLSIEAPDGSVVESDRFMVAICTCRRSQTYPLCDTSHRRRSAPSQTSDERQTSGERATQ